LNHNTAVLIIINHLPGAAIQFLSLKQYQVISAAENQPKFAFLKTKPINLIKNPFTSNIEFEKALWKSAYNQNPSSPLIKFL
jgi:hypothetical protein